MFARKEIKYSTFKFVIFVTPRSISYSIWDLDFDKHLFSLSIGACTYKMLIDFQSGNEELARAALKEYIRKEQRIMNTMIEHFQITL